MRPTLLPGDRIRLDAGRRPRLGDLVVLHLTGASDARGPMSRLVVHRVVRLTTEGLITWGDHVRGPDEWVSLDDVLGVVTAVERPGAPGPLASGRLGRLAVVAARAARGERHGRLRPGHAVRMTRWLGPQPSEAERWLCALLARALESGAVRASEDRAGVSPEMETGPAMDAVPSPPRSQEAVATMYRPTADDLLGDAVSGEDTHVTERAAQAVATAAHTAQVGPLAAAGLAGLPSDHLLRTTIVPQAAAGWSRARKLAAVADEALAGLAAAGIPVLVHKGLAYQHTVYADPSLRIAGDIDLSVRDRDRGRAEAALADLRGRLVKRWPTRREPDGVHIELDGTAHHDFDLSQHGGGRWRTGPFDWDGIWARSRHITIQTRPARVPEPTDMLVLACANAVRRGFSPVRLVADVAAVVFTYRQAIDWQQFDERVHAAGFRSRSWMPLDYAATWFAAPVPAVHCEPPAGFSCAVYERLALEMKRAKPLLRLPTRLLWAGSTGAAGQAAAKLARAWLVERGGPGA